MARSRKEIPEENALLIRHVEVGLECALTVPQSCEDRKAIERTYDQPHRDSESRELRWSRRVKALEQENAKLKRLVAELSLQKLALKDILLSRGL
jgi:putative transposase